MLIPVIRLLNQNDQYEVVVSGYGYAMERFLKKGVSVVEIKPVNKNEFSMFRKLSPDLIITSATSLPFEDMSEKFIWYNAQKHGVPTLAFLDQWQNYVLRFSGNTKEERLKYFPDYINCINNIAKEEMIGKGIDSRRLLTLGHPYLTWLKNDISKSHGKRLRKSLNIADSEKVVLFVSEAVYEYFGRDRGYTQYDVIENFLQTLALKDMNDAVLLKLHPKEDSNNYRHFIKKYSGLDIRILTNQLPPEDCLAVSDRVCGMTSIMLIEAYILGKPVVTIQPDLREEDPLVLSRHGYIPRISSFEDFSLGEKTEGRERKKFDYEFEADEFLNVLDDIVKPSKAGMAD